MKPLAAGKKRLAGDVVREAKTDELKNLHQETLGLKQVVAELLMENRFLKKRSWGTGRQVL